MSNSNFRSSIFAFSERVTAALEKLGVPFERPDLNDPEEINIPILEEFPSGWFIVQIVPDVSGDIFPPYDIAILQLAQRPSEVWIPRFVYAGDPPGEMRSFVLSVWGIDGLEETIRQLRSGITFDEMLGYSRGGLN